MNLEQARFNMIEQQIRPWDVLDAHVLQLLSLVKREDFVPVGQKTLAFVDMEINLPCGQFMLAPRVEARLLQDLALHRHEKVLEIGTGSGHMAALLAHCCQQVISLEIEPELTELARNQLHRAGLHNVEVRLADGSHGAPGDGLFDVILLSGSVAEIPPVLLAQLKVGGRLGAIVGHDPMMQATFVTRTSAAEFRTTQRWDTVAPRLLHFPEPSHFNF